jgi:hypothetical protein
MAHEPTTLQEAVIYFADPDNCREYVVPRRWPNGVICPTCGSDKVTFQPKHNRWQCSSRHSRRQFSLKTGTVMEDSPIGLDKWLVVMWRVASNRNGISSWGLHRALGVTQKTAWFLLHRVRLAMQDDLSGGSLGGEVEIDETYIGGKARNMHKERKRRVQKEGRNIGGTSIVLGMLERGKTVRATVIPERTEAIMQPIIGANVAPGLRSILMSSAISGAWRSKPMTQSESPVRLRERQCSHQRHGEFLESIEARYHRNLRFG